MNSNAAGEDPLARCREELGQIERLLRRGVVANHAILIDVILGDTPACPCRANLRGFFNFRASRQSSKHCDVPVVDRACFERVFGVRRRRAIQLLHQFGGYQSGRTFFIERVKLLRSLRRMARGDYEWELARRTKLVAEIERTKKLLPGRQVQIVVPAEVAEQKIADLPAGVHLQPGELRIEFNGAEELLQRLFELSQAILNDYQRFEGDLRVCRPSSFNL